MGISIVAGGIRTPILPVAGSKNSGTASAERRRAGVAAAVDEIVDAQISGRPIVERSVKAFLKWGGLSQGFAQVRCPDCRQEMFVAFSCKQRCTCPSCHQKRTPLTSMHMAEDVCASVAHRQVVLTIPKRLRLHTRFDRRLLGEP
jgi:ribosomal protein S27E